MKKTNKKGFSLIELALVIVIIAILVAAVTTGVGVKQKSEEAAANKLTGDSPVMHLIDEFLY